MLQLTNYTPYKAERAVLLDRDGNQVWVVVVKATFHLDERGRPERHDDQEAVCLAPVYQGEAGRTSLLRECEMVAEHPGTDVTLNATAHAPGGEAVRGLDVSVAVGPVKKTLRVTGDRFWYLGFLRPRKTRPEPFEAMPITYERAFGGSSGDEYEPRNPIGTGFAVSQADADGKALPNVEDPADRVRIVASRPRPAGLGAIPAGWSPRSEYGGTYDDEWARERLPLLPLDYDPRHQQSAHPDLVSARPLRGGEPVVLRNLTPDSLLSFRLPRVYLTVDTFGKGIALRQAVQLDRVIIEPDERKLVLVWRSSLKCGANARAIRETVVDTKPYLE
jgi:hypothetical protein